MRTLCVWGLVTLGFLAISSDFTSVQGQAIEGVDALSADAQAGRGGKPSPTPPLSPPRRAPEAATLILTGLGAAAVLGWARWKKNPKAG